MTNSNSNSNSSIDKLEPVARGGGQDIFLIPSTTELGINDIYNADSSSHLVTLANLPDIDLSMPGFRWPGIILIDNYASGQDATEIDRVTRAASHSSKAE